MVAGLNELCRVGAGCRVHRQTVDVAVLLGEDRRAAVNGLAHTVEDAAEHILAHAQLQRVAEKTHLRLREVDALRALEELHDRMIVLDLEDFAAADFTVRELDLGQVTPSTFLTIIRGLAISWMVLYSLITAPHLRR